MRCVAICFRRFINFVYCLYISKFNYGFMKRSVIIKILFYKAYYKF